MKSDEELILICEADREAFGELARRYRPMAFRAAFCVLHNALDAEDQVQSGLCKALEHIGQFRQNSKFSTWLVRIVVNECLMKLRQTRRDAIVSFDSCSPDTSYLKVTGESSSPEAAIAQVSLTRLLQREIRRIPPLLRHPLILRDIHERPMTEVAHRLGISVEAAKSRLSRGREELRRRLEPHLSVTRRCSDFKFSRSKRKETIV